MIKNRSLTLVLFINGQRGVEILNTLKEHFYPIQAVVVPKDVNQTVKSFVRDMGLTLISYSDSIEKDLLKYKAEVFVVAGFSKILPSSVLKLAGEVVLNLHAGRLPEYRGGSPLNWQIINGEKKIGISIIEMDEGIDTGPIVSESQFDLDGDISRAHELANENFSRMLVDALEKLKSGRLVRKVQCERDAVYWHQRSDADGKIYFKDWESRRVINFVQALTRPYPGAWAVRGDGIVRIFRAETVYPPIKGQAGRVIYLQGRGPFVICKDNAVLITDYLPDDGGNLKHGAYLK